MSAQRIVACGGATPVLGPVEHGLDTAALYIERRVVGKGDLAPFAGRDAGRIRPLDQRFPKPIRVIAASVQQG